MRRILLAAAVLLLSADMVTAACNWCGCRGGPGWRYKEDGKCVSHAEWRRGKCGNPPDTKCTYEARVPIAPTLPPAAPPVAAADPTHQPLK